MLRRTFHKKYATEVTARQYESLVYKLVVLLEIIVISYHNVIKSQ